MPRKNLVALVLVGLFAAGAAHARPAKLPGKVTIFDAEVIPAGAILTVTLRDLTEGIAKEATVARTSFKAEGKPPIHFDLPYFEVGIDPKRPYGVTAVITDARGQPLWESRAPVRVLTLGYETRVELMLRPAATPKAAPEATAFALDCGTTIFDVTIDDRGATLAGPDGTVVLPRVETSAGRKFSDGGSMLSVIGQAVYLQLPRRSYRDCKMTALRP